MPRISEAMAELPTCRMLRLRLVQKLGMITADSGRYADDTAFAMLIVVSWMPTSVTERVAGSAEAADHFVVDEEMP